MIDFQLPTRVPCSWDEQFAQYRRDFYLPAGDQTPEEYLREAANANGYEVTARASSANLSSEWIFETVAAFMQSAAGCHNGPMSSHQNGVVTGFCKHPRFNFLRRASGVMEHVIETRYDSRPVALVLEWENKPSRLRQRDTMVTPLSHEELLAKLCRKRFVSASQSRDREAQIQNGPEIDADRRIIYIGNLDPMAAAVLAKTTSCLEAPVIQRMIFRHLTARTSFEVHIAARGVKTFSLEVNISYFSLRKDGHAKRDGRLSWDGSGPLRETLSSPPIPTICQTSSAAAPSHSYNIYETQLSVSVTGIDHWRWTAWAFVDTWFESEDPMSEYYGDVESGAQPDPLAAGQMDVNPPEKNPREYFLRVFEVRIQEVEKEWNYILHVLHQDVQRIGANPLFTSPQQSFESEQGREAIRRLAGWNGDMLRLVRSLLQSLCRTIVAWDVFQTTDIGYFLYDNATCTKRAEQLLPSLRIIEKTFLNLRITHEEMEQVRWSLEELANCLARGGRNYSMFVQQRTGEHIKLLTWVTIGWSPVVIATGMCSTQEGIFPFRKNIIDFFGSLLVVGSLVGATIAVLLSRHSSLVDLKATSVPDVAAHLGSPQTLKDKEPDSRREDENEQSMPFPARIFTRQMTAASRISGKTLISRGLEISGLRDKPMALSTIP